MSRKSKITGHRHRAFRPRSSQVPEAVHVLMEFVYDMCLELGVCPICKMRLLHHKGKRVFARCEACMQWRRDYYKRKGI